MNTIKLKELEPASQDRVRTIYDLRKKILGVCNGSDTEDVFEALWQSLIFVMAEKCPDCRREIAEEFERRNVLKQSNALAEHTASKSASKSAQCH